MADANTTDRLYSGIIDRFRASLQELRNYRERKKQVKKATAHKKLKSKEEEIARDELLLSKSLRQGAIDVQQEYERHYRRHGDGYARGDENAHSSLGRTFRKLNMCYQKIVSALLQKDTKIDYRYLTSLSDVSRREALDTLSQLSFRMSQSVYELQQQNEDKKHHKRQKSTDSKMKQKFTSSKSASDISGIKGRKKREPIIRKVHLQNASSPQLAMVRPKPRRAGSAKSDVFVSVKEVPAGPPAVPASPKKHSRKHSDVSKSPPLSAVNHSRKDSAVFMNTPILPLGPVYELDTDHPLLVSTPSPPPAQRRRQDKVTPSMHTMASASTRLGEIPELKWSLPCDHEQMERLNKEHGGRPWPPPQEATKPRRGFLGMFKKSGFKTTEVAA